MSILDEIDGVLTNWRGSVDAMEWTAEEPTDERITVTLVADSAHGAFNPYPERAIWFDKQGQPIDVRTAESLLGDRAYVAVKLTRIRSRADRSLESWVSTVWLGVNHNFWDGPPVLFETMVFGGPRDGEQWRWTTEQAALAGHAVVVDRMAAEVPRRRVEDCPRWYRRSHLDARYRQRQRNRRKRR